jgi:hypothetical protein
MSGLAKVVRRFVGLWQVLSDPQRKPVEQVVREAVSLARRDGGLPWHYFKTFAYRKNAGPYTEYLDNGRQRLLSARLHSNEHDGLLKDKLRFETWFRSRGFPLPHLFASNDGPVFRLDGEERQVEDLAGFVSLMAELRSLSDSGSVFVKPIDGWQGEECERIDASSDLTSFYQRTRSRRFLFQETLVQHPVLSTINPHSINTIRVLTCRPAGDEPAVVGAVLRLGVGRSVVDNASRGGIFVGIDLPTGRLKPSAMKFFEYGGATYATHPDTGFRFDGFELPQFQDILTLAGRAAAELSYELVGWDLAITSKGIVLLEGNPISHLRLVECGLGHGLLSHSSVRKLCDGASLSH